MCVLRLSIPTSTCIDTEYTAAVLVRPKALGNLRRLEFLVKSEFTNTKSISGLSSGASSSTGGAGSSDSDVEFAHSSMHMRPRIMAMDSMEKQILLEKQQQQQRKETYHRITVALKDVEDFHQQYLADFSIAEECIIDNMSNIDGDLTTTARIIRKDLLIEY